VGAGLDDRHGASTLWLSDEGLRPPEALRRIKYASVNLIHRLTPTLLVGAETIWAKQYGPTAPPRRNLRLQLSVRLPDFLAARRRTAADRPSSESWMVVTLLLVSP